MYCCVFVLRFHIFFFRIEWFQIFSLLDWQKQLQLTTVLFLFFLSLKVFLEARRLECLNENSFVACLWLFFFYTLKQLNEHLSRVVIPYFFPKGCINWHPKLPVWMNVLCMCALRQIGTASRVYPASCPKSHGISSRSPVALYTG